MRNLKSRQALAKYEGHLYPVSNIAFAQSTYVFLSAANSECLLWNPRDQIKSTSLTVSEISNPDKIIDIATSDIITNLALKEIGDTSTFMAAVTTDQSTSVFFTKSLGGKASASKSKVVKKECVVKNGNAHEQIIHTSIVNETTLSMISGSIYSIKRSQTRLLDDQGKVQKEIVLGAEQGQVDGKKSLKKDQDHY